MNETIIIDHLFNAPPENVWRAITNKDEMKQWYFDIPEFDLKPGFIFHFTGGPEDGVEYVHECEITQVIPEKKLTYSWAYKGFAGKSYVTFELFSQQSKTLLKLTHKGINSFPKNNSDFDIANFRKGWDDIINNSLKNYLEEKKPVYKHKPE